MKSQTRRHDETSDGGIAHGVITANKVYNTVRVHITNISIRNIYYQHMLHMAMHLKK